MAQTNEPEKQASPDQKYALQVMTNVDLSEVQLTDQAARALLNQVAAGREPTVRNALLLLHGAVSLGKLRDADEVGVSRKLGQVVLYLPHGVELPGYGKVIAERVPEGILIRVVDPSGSSGKDAS